MPGEVKSWTSRLGPWLAPLAVLALALWSMRVVLPDPVHLIWGDRADTIHHVWGHWWMAQSGAEGGLTTWVSYPTGEWGSVLAPVGSLLVRPVVWLGGAVLAYNLLSLLYLLFDALAVGLLAERVTGSRRAGGIAALVLVVARPVLLHVYLGNTEGLAIGWVALIAWLGRRWDHGTGQRWVGPLIGLLSGVAVIENPYALPILVVGLPSWPCDGRSRGTGPGSICSAPSRWGC
jgi:4-amino-4-deoxy-L-arabinose transferase-like glycosyltransferase